jgi:uncharacterized alkaline shock family protein YloU
MEDNVNEISQSGSIKIDPSVVTVITSLATTEISGVASMSGGLTGDIAEKLGVKSSNRGVKVQVEEDKTYIDIFIIAEYGAKIPEVALEIQQSVKKSVETMTGLNVMGVNVHVQGISMPKASVIDETAKDPQK